MCDSFLIKNADYEIVMEEKFDKRNFVQATLENARLEDVYQILG